MSTARTLVVTGATGYLGRRVVAHALASRRFDTVVATHRHQPPLDDASTAGAHWVALDVRSRAAVDACFDELRGATVVHTAYRHHDDPERGETMREVTVKGAALVADAAYRNGCRLVHLSSDVVFAGRAAPYGEDDRPDPVHAYGRAKADAERFVAVAHPAALLVRTSLIYGGPTPGPQEHLVARALAGDDVCFFTDEVRCPVRVDDLALALVELAGRTELAGLLHVAGDEALDRLAFAAALARAVGGDPAKLVGGVSDASQPRPTSVALDSSRARALLGRTLPGPNR